MTAERETIMIATATAPTTEYITADVRRCTFCGTPMKRHGRAWICPVATKEARVISDARRASVRSTAAERVDGVSF